jgi:hypothetical protein
MGTFSTFDPAFAGFLQRRGQDMANDDRFVARNFLLDEGVPTERAAAYRSAGASTDHSTDNDWQRKHNAYLYDAVNKPRPPHVMLDSDDADHCAETFRFFGADGPFLCTDRDQLLIRVVTLDFVMRSSAEPLDTLRNLAAKVVLANAESLPTDSAGSELDAILEEWVLRSDGRPIFAGFWVDVRDAFADHPMRDAPGWEDDLRDRLGLAHYDPAVLGAIPILVLRYRVGDVARVKGADRSTRLLVPPTVLDGRHSRAFCPSPRPGDAGHTLDLSTRPELTCREVLHPPVEFRARHVFRVGTVTRPTPVDLSMARAFHLVHLQERASRPDYALDTDRDILV